MPIRLCLQILLALWIVVQPLQASAKAKFYSERQIRILRLGVTQFGVGQIEIEERKRRLAKKMGVSVAELPLFLKNHPRKLKRILKKKPVLTVLGPGQKYYVVDHHHWLTILHQLGVKEVYYTLRPNSDFSRFSDEDFFIKLKKLELMYNFDEDGNELNPLHLRHLTIADLDTYNWRGLVGLIRDAGGIKKMDTPFFEIKHWMTPLKRWYLSHYESPDFTTEEGIELAIERGLEFAASEEAQKIIGAMNPCDHLLPAQ